MADHLLANGLAGSPLRALASAAGTSDRMLLYYFADRDDLLSALLAHVAADLARQLAQEEDGERRSAAEVLRMLWERARMPALRPNMMLFMELAAAAGRGEEPQRSAAGNIVDGFVAWVAERLDGPEDDRRARAALLLATLDGLFLLQCAGRHDLADMASALIG